MPCIEQGDPAPCFKPPVDIDLKLCFSIREGPHNKTQLSHQCQQEVWNQVLGHPVCYSHWEREGGTQTADKVRVVA